MVLRAYPWIGGEKGTFSIEFIGRSHDGFEGKYLCMWNHEKRILSSFSVPAVCLSLPIWIYVVPILKEVEILSRWGSFLPYGIFFL